MEDLLQGVLADFEACSRRAVECLLNRPTLLGKPFELQPSLSAEPLRRCFVEGGNGGYAVSIFLGVEDIGLRALLPGEPDEEMRLDAVGEIVNVLSGCLFSSANFLARFGCMRATVPAFMTQGPIFAGSANVRGILLVESTRLTFEMAVNVNGVGDEI